MAKETQTRSTLWGDEEYLATTNEILSVDDQWDVWQKQNPIKSFEHIDTEKLVKILTNDLTYASSMDVKEYTLYQKYLIY